MAQKAAALKMEELWKTVNVQKQTLWQKEEVEQSRSWDCKPYKSKEDLSEDICRNQKKKPESQMKKFPQWPEVLTLLLFF